MDNAIESIQRAISLQPITPHFIFNFQLFARSDRWPETAAAQRGALTIRPDDPDVLAQLSAALARIGEHDEAMRLNVRAIHLAPESSLHHHIGGLFAMSERWPEAVELQRRALKLQPDDSKALAMLSDALARTGQIEEAITIAQQAIELMPENASLHGHLAHLNSMSKR